MQREGQLDGAIEELRRGIASDPLSARQHFVLANLLHKRSQLFEAIGLNSDTIEKYFTGTSSRVEGIGVFEIAEEALRLHKAAFGDDPVLSSMLDAGGEYAWRTRGEEHMWTPDAIAKLQHSTKANNFQTYKEYAQIINDQSRRHMTLRGLFEFRVDPSKAIPIDEVEPATEIVRRFAELGYDAICPNLHWRAAPNAAPDDAAAASRAKGGVSDEQLIGDVNGAVTALRALPTANGKVATIGYCSGGRQSVLAACNLDLDAAVDCYGAFVVGEPPADFPVKTMTGIEPLLPDLSCPLLGLFGKEDRTPSPADVETLTRLLDQHGKDFTPVSYDDAGHAFFSVDRPSYRVAAANDGWERVEAFFGRHLAS